MTVTLVCAASPRSSVARMVNVWNPRERTSEENVRSLLAAFTCHFFCDEPSTIVDVTGQQGRVLRLGALSLDELNAVLEPLGATLTDEG